MRTVVMTIGYFTSTFIYYQMVINVSNMVGNTFLNLFLLGLVEGPGNVLGEKGKPANIEKLKLCSLKVLCWLTKWDEGGPTALSLASTLSCLELSWSLSPTRCRLKSHHVVNLNVFFSDQFTEAGYKSPCCELKCFSLTSSLKLAIRVTMV